MDNIATLIREGKIADAEASLNHRRAEAQSSADWHYQRGLLLVAMGRPEEAIAEYGHAVRLNPAHAEAIFQLAFTQDLYGDDERAIGL